MGTGIDLNRGTDHVVLNKITSPEIFHKLEKESAIMRMARRVVLPGAGIDFQKITADPTASWVNETDIKPVSTPTLGVKTMKGYTVATILPVSKQLARDKASLVAELIGTLPLALGKKFDESCFGVCAKPGTDFDQFSSCNAVSIASSTYDGLVQAETAIGNQKYIADGYLFAPQAKGNLLLAKDNINRPLFINDLRNEGEGSLGHVLGNPTYFNPHVYKAGTAGTPGTPEQLGIVGQWNKALYGIVESISVDKLTEAAITVNGQLISLPERNMVAYRAEMEVGFMIVDTDAFVRLTGAVPTTTNGDVIESTINLDYANVSEVEPVVANVSKKAAKKSTKKSSKK